MSFSGKTVKLAGTDRYGIGIQLVDRTRVVTKPEVKINSGDIGGPSAGLMFTLECYQLFTRKNLSPNQKIAGTGTIDSNGKVGMIGGVDKKVIAASRQGMKVFLRQLIVHQELKRVRQIMQKQSGLPKNSH